MHGPTLREGVWAVERSPDALHTPGADSLRTAWARGLAVVRTSARDAGDVAAVDEALQAASRTLDAMESLARTQPASTGLNMPSLVDATVNALASLTDDAVDEGDPIGLLTWLLAQDSQLRARLDGWSGVLAALSDPPLS